jgi:hypothetical protein
MARRLQLADSHETALDESSGSSRAKGSGPRAETIPPFLSFTKAVD